MTIFIKKWYECLEVVNNFHHFWNQKNCIHFSQSNEKQKLREYRHEVKVRKRARVLAPLLGSKEAGTLWYQLVIAEPPYQFPPPVSPLRHLSLYHVPFCTLALPSFFFLSLAYALKYVATSRKLLSFVGSIQGWIFSFKSSSSSSP